MKSEVFNIDCMIGMKDTPDNWYDLAVVDPEQGLGQNKNNGKSIGLRKKWVGYNKQKYKEKSWDENPAPASYFNELLRVSKNQIIWGYNYFYLPPTRGIIGWNKKCEDTSFSDFELAWTSFETKARLFTLPIQAESQIRIHPTQKPVRLYEWIFKNYAKEGMKILDTHGGSMSSVIAAMNYGMEITCYEKDLDYYKAAKKRILNHLSQLHAFNAKPEIYFDK